DLAEAHVRRGTAVPLVAADVLRCAAHGPVDAVRGVWRAALTLHRVDEAHVPRTLRTAEVGRHVSTDGGTARTTDRSSPLRRIAAHLAWVRAVAERARGRVDAAVPGEDAFETRAPTTIRAVVAARARRAVRSSAAHRVVRAGRVAVGGVRDRHPMAFRTRHWAAVGSVGAGAAAIEEGLVAAGGRHEATRHTERRRRRGRDDVTGRQRRQRGDVTSPVGDEADVETEITLAEPERDHRRAAGRTG